MPARLRSKLIYRKEFLTGYTQADLLKWEKQLNANEIHLRARPAKKMKQNTQPTINGLSGFDHPCSSLYRKIVQRGHFFSAPNATVESSDKTKILVGKHA